ncbi:hypothetical protein [Flavobacterium aestivum]|uniref:hypothetical protein n=1 Tax=Flavobacterium aestivum TaxID=3003257 RepID=UPI0024829230|nr:hypothetical protein [Flavobacterium aestivum]
MRLFSFSRIFFTKAFQLIVLLLCFSCSKTDKELNNLKASLNSSTDISKKTDDKNTLHKLEKLFCVGDFDGDGKRDTIFQHNFSKLRKGEIEKSPDPAKNEWEDIIKWFSKQDSDVYLAFNKKDKDTLHLGTVQGLYCLLNIGDTNFDGKDEMAFVIDNLDFSNLNSCKIYSLCKGKWVELKQFNIDESAFDFTSTKIASSDIQNYLEQKDNKWFYKDNLQDEPKMQLLKLDECQ